MELRERIAELATAAGIDLTSVRIAKDRCWVDGRVRCPYGSPEGQYLLRPEAFCHDQRAQGDGCATFHQHVEDPELTEQMKRDAVREHFEAAKTDVIGELRARAEELQEGSPEQLALRLAADVIDDKKLNRSILLEEDLPKDK